MLDQTGRGAACAPYSLLAPLPSDVVMRPSGQLTDYRSYPVFSLPWLRGRSLIFAPVGTGLALMESTIYSTVISNLTQRVEWVLLDVLLWLCIVGAGPALATGVRHRGWPSRWERPAVFAAIAVGIGLSFAAMWLVNRQLGALVEAPYRQLLGEAGYAQIERMGAAIAPFIHTWQFVIFFCMGGGLALRNYVFEHKRWQEVQREKEMEALRRQKSESDLRVTVLQAQVEPHFLFNTLASVHSLIRKDPQRAEATIEALVDHLRATMPKLRAGLGQTHTTLAEQLEVCESYLRVMQVRMGARLTWLRDVPERLLKHPFPPLILISLVENAIKHGIEPSACGGNISLTAAIEDRGMSAQLAVSVIDDGVGLTPGLGGGVGLANIRAQLAARFGEYGELAIRARPAGGVTATIRVPCVEAEPCTA